MPTDHVKSSHHLIQSFEADQLKNRPKFIQIADRLTLLFGSISFFILNALLFIVWIAINTGFVPFVPVFDPYPFILLTMFVSLEAIFLSIIVLMSQNRQGHIFTLREELDMQVNLLAEREITMSLKILKLMASKMGIKIRNEELGEMVKETDISYIQREIQEQIQERTRLSRKLGKK
ncbi:MAG: DUF1003 domain-containing protein [Candidatus Woesebacteria bacterium]|nr:MAG: DUF1003 domain-containing protein [Candidatus Woesebacteria bacterium]